MNDIKTQLEWVRDVRKKRLAVITCWLDKPEKVVAVFPMTKLAEAEKYAERMRPSRITDTKNMEVIRWYAVKEPTLDEACAILQKKAGK